MQCSHTHVTALTIGPAYFCIETRLAHTPLKTNMSHISPCEPSPGNVYHFTRPTWLQQGEQHYPAKSRPTPSPILKWIGSGELW